MNRTFTRSVAIVVIMTLLMTIPACYGSFNLVKKVYTWNKGFGDKWIQEIGFIVMTVVPIYGGAAVIDALILNSVEFWTGKNPVAATIDDAETGVHLAYDATQGAVIYSGTNAQYSFVRSQEGTIVRDGTGNFLVRCTATENGGIMLTDVQGKTVASYSDQEVQRLYEALDRGQ